MITTYKLNARERALLKSVYYTRASVHTVHGTPSIRVANKLAKMGLLEIERLNRTSVACAFTAAGLGCVAHLLPPCVVSMGCLCAGHARGAAESAPCDTTEGS